MKKYLLILLIAVSGCSEPRPFNPGDCAQVRLDDRKGMVARGNLDGAWIRFSALSVKTNTRLLGPDGEIEISPYSSVFFRYFELKKCEFTK